MSTISTRDIEALMAQFCRAGWQEMHLRVGSTELFLSADGSARSTVGARSSVPAVAATNAALAAPPSPSKQDTPAGWFTVLAPSLGSFYRAPKPGAPAFADIGAHVTADSDLGVIEVLNLFTTFRAGVAGTVREVYVQDGELVEFEQPLFLIEPHANHA